MLRKRPSSTLLGSGKALPNLDFLIPRSVFFLLPKAPGDYHLEVWGPYSKAVFLPRMRSSLPSTQSHSGVQERERRHQLGGQGNPLFGTHILDVLGGPGVRGPPSRDYGS